MRNQKIIPSPANFGCPLTFCRHGNFGRKSTTISCLLGLLPYDAGKVTFENGVSIRKWSKYIGYVPQDLAIYPELTTKENKKSSESCRTNDYAAHAYHP